MTDLRTCYKCKISKSLTEYHKRTGYPNDKNTICKKCLNSYNRTQRVKRISNSKDDILKTFIISENIA